MVVPFQKTIKLHAFILVNGLLDPTPVTTQTAVDAALQVVQQRWAQCGIQVTYTIDTETSNPSGVSNWNPSGFFNFYQGNNGTIIFPDESKALFNGLPGASGEICIYYVNNFITARLKP